MLSLVIRHLLSVIGRWSLACGLLVLLAASPAAGQDFAPRPGAFTSQAMIAPPPDAGPTPTAACSRGACGQPAAGAQHAGRRPVRKFLGRVGRVGRWCFRCR